MKKLSLVLSAVVLVSLAVWARQAADTGPIKITVSVSPNAVIVDRTAGGSMNRGVADIWVALANTSSSDYSKTLEPGQVFDVEVFSAKQPATPLWKWSTGRKFVPSLKFSLGAGKDGREKVIWSFDPSKVPDGDYKAIGTFVPTGAKSEATFSVKSGM